MLGVLSACIWDQPTSNRPPIPPEHAVEILYLPTTQTQCRCRAVEPTTVYTVLRNPDARRTAGSVLRVASRIIGSNTPYNWTPLNVPDLGPGDTFPLGCSVIPDQSAGGECRIEARWTIAGSVYRDRIGFAEDQVAVAPADRDGPTFCRAQCEVGNPNCFDLGNTNARLARRFVTLLEAAHQTNRDRISIAEIYQSMGADPNEAQCRRDDILISPTHVTNSGPNNCVLARTSVAALFSDLTFGEKLALLRGPFDGWLEIDRDVVMTRRPTALHDGLGTYGVFEDAERGLSIGFLAPPLSAGPDPDIDRLNELYSGFIRDIFYFERQASGVRAIGLSTTRGCISMSMPRGG